MKKTYALLMAASLATACQNTENSDTETATDQGQEQQQSTARLEKVWETDTEFPTNESVFYYEDENVLFVSNIDGQPTEKDGKGFISKLSPEGDMQNHRWVTGIDAPKGMGVKDGKLYVTNIDELVEIDIAEGEISNRYAVEGAEFLNDVVVAQGAVFFSDMNTGKLHKLVEGQVSVEKDGLSEINGVAEMSGQLYMLTAEGLQRMNDDGAVQTVNGEVTGGDGLVIIDRDTFLASRWKGEIWLIKNEKPTKLLDSTEDEVQTADIGYIPQQNLVLVPRFFANKVTAYRLVRE